MRSRFPLFTVLLLFFLVLIVSWHYSGRRSADESSRWGEPVVDSFQAWCRKASVVGELDGLMLEEGVALAKARREWMVDLIKSDPRAALAEAVSFSEYGSLPEEVQVYVERPFSQAAELLVLPICMPGVGEKQTVVHRLVMDGRGYDASVFGRRVAVGSKEGTPLQGITLGEVAAVREEVFQVISGEEGDQFPQGQRDFRRCFATGELLGGEAVMAVAGGKQFHFSNEEVLVEFDVRVGEFDEEPGPHTGSRVIFLMADGEEGGEFDWAAAEAEVELQASAWTETPKDVYFIRVDFSDVPGASISQLDLSTLMNTTVTDTIYEMSYGKTEINGTVSGIVVRMPSPTTAYTSTNNNLLHEDAKAAAQAQIPGLVLSDYDIVGVHFASIGMGSSALSSYAGLAGGTRQWIQGSSSSNVMIHEFGHNYGIGHASFWDTTDGSVVGTGGSDEYGDDFDIMGDGPNNAHPNPQAKVLLDWLEPAQWTDVTSAGSGTYRVYRFDNSATTGVTRGLRITKAASPSEYYWLGYRKNLVGNPWLQAGAYLIWERPGFNRSWLLDTSPGSAEGRDDGAILPGKTYTDSVAGVHITTVGGGGTAPNDWIDVTVNLGSFSGNAVPTATLSGPSTANAREGVVFSVSASDPNGDQLAYYWDLGDGSIASNVASQTLTWAVGGTYTVSVTVSDMKGGVVTRSQMVTVSDPLNSWTQRTSGTTADLFDIATDGTKLVAVGAGSGTYRTSTDAVTWTGGTVGINVYLRGVVWDGARFLAAGQNYEFAAPAGWRGTIYTSLNGTSWTSRIFSGEELNDIASNGSVAVAVGDAGTIWRSTDSVNWSPIASGVAVNLNGVSYGDGKFVAVGAASNGGSGVVLTSTDGTSWTNTSTGAGLASWQGFYDVDYCNDRFLASGWYTKIRHSTDVGVNFLTTRLITEQIPGFAYGNGVYLAAGKDTTDFNVSYVQNLLSTDGEAWTQLTTNQSQNERNGVVFFDDTFITVANGGQIWQSSPFTAPASGSGFSAWLDLYFTGATPAANGLLDPDGDGASNLQEYAIGSDPTVASRGVQPVSEEVGGYLTLTVVKDPTVTDINYRVERSTDLDGWDTAGTVVMNDDATTLVVRSATPISNVLVDTEFLRVVYTLVE